MIKYNNSTINDWYFYTSDVIKVYRNNAICYYKLNASGTYDLCYAVVEDISQYSETEFKDVYDKATEKWYKLNNLNQYEEYGIYGSGRNITYYEGKLTIDDGYEYIHSGSSWVSVGEVSGSTQIIKSPEYIERTSSYNGYCGLLEYLTQDTKIIIKHRQTGAGGGRIIGDWNSNDSDDWRFFFYSSTLYYDFITQRQSVGKTMPMSAAEEWEVGNYYIKNTATGTNILTGTTQTFSSRPAPLYIYHSDGIGAGESGNDYGQIYYIKIYKNDVLVRDFIPWTDMNGNYGLFDKVECELVETTGQMTASTTINDVEVSGGQSYPLYYDEKSDPLDNLTFETMEEAQTYAYNNCVYDGMKATIDGDRYVFSGDSTSGYEWVYQTSRLPVGYTEVQYIQNTSRSYIDTGFKPNQDTRIVCKMQCVTSTQYGRYIGCGGYSNINAIQFDYESYYNGTLHISWGTNAGWSTYSNCVGDYEIHEYDWDKNYFYRDKGETNQFSASTTYAAFQCTDNLGIFTFIQNGSPSAQYSTEYLFGKMYSFQIYDNGTLIRDLVPCKRDSDNLVGAYDIVNNVFYYTPNYSSYPMLAGPEIT